MARSELESGMKSIKYILLIITTMFIVVSALMITLGISVYSKYHDFSFILQMSAQNFLAPSVLVTITGMAMLVITLFGFIGCLRESTCLVNVYALILTCLLIVQVAVIAIGFSADEDQITQHIKIPVSQYATDREIQRDVDFLQASLNCCGSASMHDYEDVQFNSEHHTVTCHNTSLVIPQTCCYQYSQGETTGYCMGVWHVGCRTAMVGLVVQNAGVLGVLALSVAFIQLLGIIFSVLLARNIRKVKSERAYLRWKTMERMIAARSEHKEAMQSPFIYIEASDSTKA